VPRWGYKRLEKVTRGGKMMRGITITRDQSEVKKKTERKEG